MKSVFISGGAGFIGSHLVRRLLRAAGYRNLWTPFAEFYHHESASRGADDTEEKRERFRRETETMLARWGEELAADPAYNPNLTLELTDFSLAAWNRAEPPARRSSPAAGMRQAPRLAR